MPTTDPPSFQDARNLYRSGNFDSAVKKYNELIQAGSQPSLAYAGLARAFLKLKKVKEACAAASKAVEFGPELDDAHAALGEVYFRQGRMAEAENKFFSLVRAHTKNARAYLGMARVSEVGSLHKQAKELIDEAHTLDPSDPDIRLEWLSRYSVREQVKALQDYLSGQADEVAPERSELEKLLKHLKDDAALPAHPCRLVTQNRSAEIDLRSMKADIAGLHGYGLNMQLNGVPARLLLDTGANGILVNHRFAKKAGIMSVESTKIGGVGDQAESKGYIGGVESARIGDLEFRGCNVEVVENRQLDDSDGIIGVEMFSHYLVDLDLPNSRLKLSELPLHPGESAQAPDQDSGPTPRALLLDRYVAPLMKSFTPVYQFDNQLILWAKVNETDPKLFVIDTGSSLTLISSDTAQQVTNITRSRLGLQGLAGNVQNVVQGGPVTLTFGNIRQKNSNINAFDMRSISDSYGTEVSGILGISVLRLLEMKIDYRDGLVQFIPAPNLKR